MEQPTTAGTGLARPPSSHANRPRTARGDSSEDALPRTARSTTSRARPPTASSQASSRPFTRARGTTAAGGRPENEQAACVARLRAKRAAVQRTNESLQVPGPPCHLTAWQKHLFLQEQLEQLEKAAVHHEKRQAFLNDLRAEVERLQGALAQHNLIIDAVVGKTPLDALQRDLEALTQANAGAAESLGTLAEQRAAAEAATRTLQAEAERLQGAMAEQLELLPDAVRWT